MRSRALVLALCCAIYILGMFHRSSPAVLADSLMADFAMDAAGMGLLGGSAMLALGIMQLPSGVLSDAWGSRRVIFWLTVLAATGVMLFALSGGMATALPARLAVGVGLAISVPIFALLAEIFPPSAYGRALSVVTASGSLGVMLAAPPLVFLQERCGWRATLVLFAALTLTAALLFRLGAGRNNHGSSSSGVAPSPSGGTANRAGGAAMLRGVLAVLRTRAFWPLCLWQLCIMGSFFTLLTLWWVPYLTHTAGCTPMQASTILMAVSVIMVILQPAMAWLSDVVFRARRAPLVAVTLLSFMGMLSMVFLTGRMNYAALLVQALLLSAAVSAAPLLFAMVRETFPPTLTGTALGCVNMLYPMWTAILSSLYGLIVQAFDAAGPQTAYSAAGILLAANVGVGVLASLVMKESFNRAPVPPAA